MTKLQNVMKRLSKIHGIAEVYVFILCCYDRKGFSSAECSYLKIQELFIFWCVVISVIIRKKI